MNIGQIFKKGLFDENPIFVQVIAMCPALAVTTSLENGVGMGLATLSVLVCSNFVLSLIRKCIPDKIRIPCYIVVIATFVTIVQFLLAAFLPGLNDALGIFIPLIVVNCLVMARAESFAGKNSPLPSFFDGMAMGLGFTLGLGVIGAIREVLGSGTLLGQPVLPDAIPRNIIMILPPGAFFTLAMMIAFITWLKKGRA